MDVRPELRYTTDHEWLAAGDPATIGITAYAAEALGDIVFVQLPALGDHVEAGAPCAELESTKSVSEVIAPVSGEIVAVNSMLNDEPGLINEDPYGEGWLFKIRSADPLLSDLLSAADYAALIEANPERAS